MKAITWLSVGLCLAGGLNAQDKQPLGIDDFLRIGIVGDPQVSPNGSMVAYAIATPSLKDNRTVSRLRLVDLLAGTSRELTSRPGSDQSPRWAKDGRTLAFLSNRNGTSQVWRIRIDGGEPSPITSIATGVNEYWWSPDTTAVFVSSDVKWPEAGELDARHGDYPTGARLFTGLFYRHWNEWRSGTRQHLFRVDLATGGTTDLTPFDRDVPTLALGGHDVAISPLGTELAIVFNPDSVVATSTNNDIFLIGPDGTGIVPMTETPGNDHSPVYSPNARWIAYLTMATPGFEADRQQIVLYDRATGERKPIAPEWDRSVQSLTWAPDSRSVVAVVEERGGQNLYRVAIPTGLRTLLVSGGVNSHPQFTPTGDAMVFVRQSATQPPELFLIRWDGKPIRQLTQTNSLLLAGIEQKPAVPFGFVGANGDSVFGYLIKPPGFDSTKTYPVAYLIHGGPQGAWLDTWHLRWNYSLFAARGYVVAAVNFHGSTGYGQAFTNSISKHWGDLPYQDLMKGVDYLAALPYVDATRIGAAGASYGGYMIYWMAGHTDRFKTLIAHDGIYNTESMAGTTEEQWFPLWEFGGPMTLPEPRTLLGQWSPANFVTQWKTPMLVVHGQQDFRVDVSEGYQAYTALQLRRIPSKFLYFPDEGHFVLKPRNRRLWWGVVLDWLDESLRPGAAKASP